MRLPLEVGVEHVGGINSTQIKIVFLPGIVSRASANGQLYEEEDDIEHDSLSLSNPEASSSDNNNRKPAWVTSNSVQTGGGGGSAGVTANGVSGSNLLTASAEDVGSSENNLTVYF